MEVLMKPYVRQKPVVNAVITAINKTGRALMVLATGLGKTPISAFIVDGLKPRNVLFLCHQTNILDQTHKEVYSKVFPHMSVTFFSGNRKEKHLHGQLVFASFQSIHKHYDQLDPKMFDMIIVDESHHSRAYTYEEVLAHFKPKYLLGMTATKDRMDGLPIEAIFGEAVVNIGLKTAISKGWLTPFDYRIVSDHISNDEIKKMLDEINAGVKLKKKDINSRIFIQKRDKAIAKKILAENRKTIVFCRNKVHTERMAKLLPNSASYHSSKTQKENDESLNSFRKGEIKYICCVDMLNEGVDVPDVEMIAFARSTMSKTTFLQQLGRSLRKKRGKKKVLVLDFVGTISRLKLLMDLIPHAKDKPDGMVQSDMRPSVFELDGKGYSFQFDETMLNMLSILDKINTEFYPTWQEASKAAIALGIRKQVQYNELYKKDSRLPSQPRRTYQDYPGDSMFFGGEKKEFYSTWQEASKAAIALGIDKEYYYIKEYSKDKRLPGRPNLFYEDFPGFDIFFGYKKKESYKTWQEASKAAIALGIKSHQEYKKFRSKDDRLPMDLNYTYKDFPGYFIFLGKDKYKTWQEASKAAIALGIKSTTQYRKQYKKDKKLPASPENSYENFPGFTIFLGGEKKEFYSTWQEASKAAIALGIKGQVDYNNRYNLDPKLPSSPSSYYDNYPGMAIFLVKK